MESQLWQIVTGTVDEVIDATTIRILVSDPAPHSLAIKMVGVRKPADRESAKAAISFLRRQVLGHQVAVFLGLNDRYFKRRTAGHVHGWLGEVSVVLVENGFVAYEPAKSCRMSHYDECLHRLAQERAKRAGVGIWRRSDPKP